MHLCACGANKREPEENTSASTVVSLGMLTT